MTKYFTQILVDGQMVLLGKKKVQFRFAQAFAKKDGLVVPELWAQFRVENIV